MAALVTKNPWGKKNTTYEVQRKDLWVVDFSQVLSPTTGLPAFSGWSRIVPQNVTDAAFCAMSVSFPEMMVSGKSFPGLSTPVYYPDVDEPLGQIRIQFLVNADLTGQSISRFHNILEAWRTLVRAGRDGFSNEFVPILSAENNYTYRFRWDIPITLYAGTSTSTVASFDTATAATDGMSVSGSYLISQAWLASYQIGELVYAEGNQVHIITGIFYARTILSTQSGQGRPGGTVSGPSANGVPNTTAALGTSDVIFPPNIA